MLVPGLEMQSSNYVKEDGGLEKNGGMVTSNFHKVQTRDTFIENSTDHFNITVYNWRPDTQKGGKYCQNYHTTEGNRWNKILVPSQSR